MGKYLKIEASTTGTVLIGLDNIGLVAKASNTTVTISYASGNAAVDVMTITHTSDATLQQLKQSLTLSLKLAEQTSLLINS